MAFPFGSGRAQSCLHAAAVARLDASCYLWLVSRRCEKSPTRRAPPGSPLSLSDTAVCLRPLARVLSHRNGLKRLSPGASHKKAATGATRPLVASFHRLVMTSVPAGDHRDQVSPDPAGRGRQGVRLDGAAESRLDRVAETDPASLSRAEFQVGDFVGRDQELAALADRERENGRSPGRRQASDRPRSSSLAVSSVSTTSSRWTD